MDRHGEDEPILGHLDAFMVDAAGDHHVLGHAHGPEDATENEVREALGEQYGVEPDNFEVHKANSERGKRAGRLFGFPDWNGSTWQPSGPKGNPTLN